MTKYVDVNLIEAFIREQDAFIKNNGNPTFTELRDHITKCAENVVKLKTMQFVEPWNIKGWHEVENAVHYYNMAVDKMREKMNTEAGWMNIVPKAIEFAAPSPELLAQQFAAARQHPK